MPRGENAASRSSLRALALLGLLVAADACIERPSDDECRAMADHIVELERGRHQGRAAELAAEVTRQRREALRQTCLDEGTADEVRCVLGLESFDQLSRCNPR